SRRQAQRQLGDAVVDEPILGNQDNQRAAGAETDKFQVLQRALLFRDDDDSGAMRQARECARRLLQRLGEAFAAGSAKALYAAPLVLGEAADLEQAVDEKTQTRFGRQSPGRGM